MKPGDLLIVRHDTRVMTHLAGKPALVIRKITHVDWDGEPFFEFEVIVDGVKMWLTDDFFEVDDDPARAT